jgi:anaerobic C4-dicarboxylate transporter
MLAVAAVESVVLQGKAVLVVLVVVLMAVLAQLALMQLLILAVAGVVEATSSLVALVVLVSLLFLIPVYREVLAVLLLQPTGTPSTPLRLAQPPLRHKDKT